MDPNRLVLRGGSLGGHQRELPTPMLLNQQRQPRIPPAVEMASSSSEALALAAPGIVGALALFLVMFALIGAYWRCRRVTRVGRRNCEESRSTPYRRGVDTEFGAATGASVDCGGGCRIIVNPLMECGESKHASDSVKFSLRNGSIDSSDEDLSDLESELSACSCDNNDADCAVCRRGIDQRPPITSGGPVPVRLASPESELDDIDEEKQESRFSGGSAASTV